jgi:2-oxoglutarate dehydrogenase E2 component (dihydrolipoamide succinyltransferase)
LTFTPLLITALIKALKDFPLLNSSVEGDKIIQKREINIGMATAMADGNLIVPVIRNANHLNLVGLAKSVNDLAHRARSQNLKPDEVQGGTYTFTNIGNFGSLTGIPIINQPQVGIVAVGVIRKMPSVMESKEGDSIAIRKKVIISHSYDHRIINGALGGKFIKSMADFLEKWDMQQTI